MELKKIFFFWFLILHPQSPIQNNCILVVCIHSDGKGRSEVAVGVPPQLASPHPNIPQLTPGEDMLEAG